MWFSHTQLMRAVAIHRRLIREELDRQIKSNDNELTWLAGSVAPVRSNCRRLPNGRRSPESEQVAWLKAVGAVGYSFHGQSLLRRDSTTSIDELIASVQERLPGWSDDRVVAYLAGLVATGRTLRGRGGRYGCISRGVSSVLAVRLTEHELARTLAVGEIDSAAKELGALLDVAIGSPDESALSEFRRRIFALLEYRGEPDEAYRDLFVPEYAELIDIVMSDPRHPRRLTWRQLAIEALGITSNLVGLAAENLDEESNQLEEELVALS